MKISILTLMPQAYPGLLGESLIGKALEKGTWGLDVVNIRDFAEDKHQTVDDTAFGGGPGMVMRADVVDRALSSVATKGQTLVLNMSPRGETFHQGMAQSLTSCDHIVFLCGRYEGIDQRVLDAWDVRDVSLGDFVLTGGDSAAMAMVEGIIRLLPGVVGDEASLEEESFSSGLLEYPHYTRPRVWNDCEVPAVLLSGNHKEIATWRLDAAKAITAERRPDMWEAFQNASQNL